MGLDVSDAHAAGIEPEDLVVQPGQPGLALGHQLGLEAALAVAGRVDLHRPEIGLDRLRGAAVAVVAAGARRRLTRPIAQMVCQLGAQGGLDDPSRQTVQKAARTGDLLRA
jgi:hypothetical protein